MYNIECAECAVLLKFTEIFDNNNNNNNNNHNNNNNNNNNNRKKKHTNIKKMKIKITPPEQQAGLRNVKAKSYISRWISFLTIYGKNSSWN